MITKAVDLKGAQVAVATVSLESAFECNTLMLADYEQYIITLETRYNVGS